MNVVQVLLADKRAHFIALNIWLAAACILAALGSLLWLLAVIYCAAYLVKWLFTCAAIRLALKTKDGPRV